MNKNYIFGPVPSRRLGRSLGVDIIPYKTCSYDCVYCQLGKTTNKTIKLQNFAPVDKILKQLKTKLKTKPKVDYITLSGSGEPTLYLSLHKLIKGIKNITDLPVSVLTNGSLLWKESVKKSLLLADLIVPSLDAGSSEAWKKINSPVNEIDFHTMLNGIIDFSNGYKGELWLEILFVKSINDTDKEIKKLISHSKKIKHNKIQLNTIVRPPYKSEFKSVESNKLFKIAELFGKKAEVIADFHSNIDKNDFKITKADIISLLKRRPCSAIDVANGLNIHANEAIKYLDEMIKKREADIKVINGKNYYSVSAS